MAFKDKIGWGIIGPGRIARDFAESMKLVPDAFIAAAGSRSLERSTEYCEKYGGTPYGSYEELCSDPNVDIVYVAVPHPMHEEAVKIAAAHGKNILCEKPFACNKASAERMFGYAKEAGVFIQEGQWSRYFPAWQFVRDLIASGKMGKVEHVASCTAWAIPPEWLDKSNRLLDPNLAGGALLDGGLYSFAAMSVGTGKVEEPEEFYSIMKFTDTGVDHDSEGFMKFKDGMTALLSCSLYRKDFWTTFSCEDGIIRVPKHRHPFEVFVQRKAGHSGEFVTFGEESRYYFPWESKGFQFEIEAVQKHLRDGCLTSPSVTPEETLLFAGWCDRIRAKENFVYPFEK